MPFNSNTYHANRCREAAWKYLAEARAYREQVRAGQTWRQAFVESAVKLARINMHLSLGYLRIRALNGKNRRDR